MGLMNFLTGRKIESNTIVGITRQGRESLYSNSYNRFLTSILDAVSANSPCRVSEISREVNSYHGEDAEMDNPQAGSVYDGVARLVKVGALRIHN